MMKIVCIIGFLLLKMTVIAQQKDSVKILDKVVVTGYKTIHGIGHFLESKDGVIYAGKKNEILIVDSLDANKAINNTRQILGRIPGLNIVETESSGFTSNGIATRGLNPIQSIEMNTRQNGYNISADVSGYNESYYIPPMESVKRIEFVRGAGALQFGAHFGGMVNYVLEEASNNKLAIKIAETTGSYGLLNSFLSLGGTFKKFTFYGYMQYRYMKGYRANSSQYQLSSFINIGYKLSPIILTSIEYSSLRNRIKMPGGLSDSMFNINARSSTRSRNWLTSPWNIISNNIKITPSLNTCISIINTYIFSNRSLVWRNEEGGPNAEDNIDTSTGQYVSREVNSEDMHSVSSETRISSKYKILKNSCTIAAGIRFSYGWFKRQGGGQGTTNSDFDLSHIGPWGYDLFFTSSNIAVFIENIFHPFRKLSITPGIRVELLGNTVKGFKNISNSIQTVHDYRTRKIPLLGLGTEWKMNLNSNFYANVTQSYRPIDYSQLEPFGLAAKIDPNLKDATGYNADLGFKGSKNNFLNYDVSLFYLRYNDRIGEIIKKDNSTGTVYGFRTNVANSVHKGLESYIEFNILKYSKDISKTGIRIFNSFAYINAQYVSGLYKGKRVEAAAKTIERMGIIINKENLSATIQLNYVGDAYGDATNLKISENPIGGYIPSYTVMDLSLTYKLKNTTLKTGMNNIANARYFTRRTDEYPGPGIIPSIGRSIYIGFIFSK